MSNIHIRRSFTMPRAELRKQLEDLTASLQEKWPLECQWQTDDCLSFKHSAVKGEIEIGKDEFELKAELGLLFGAFKGAIENEIAKFINEHVY